MRRLIAAVIFILIASVSQASERPEKPEKIVSLAPQVTETLYALGLAEKIVGVTTFCDYPPEAKKKPKVGGMSNPSLEAIVSLKPDIVILTTDGNPQWAEERLNALKIKTYVVRARRLVELPSEIRAMGAVLVAGQKAEELAGKIESAFSKFKAPHDGRRILFIIWPEPLIVAGPGTAVDDAIILVGLENVARGTGINYPKYSVEEAIRARPDIIAIGSGAGMEGFSKGLLKRLKDTPAVKGNKVFFVGDGLYRLGPRVIDGIRELAEAIGSQAGEATGAGK